MRSERIVDRRNWWQKFTSKPIPPDSEDLETLTEQGYTDIECRLALRIADNDIDRAWDLLEHKYHLRGLTLANGRTVEKTYFDHGCRVCQNQVAEGCGIHL